MKKIIIDTDAGIDDGQAIVMALNSDDLVEVVAITTCHGNVDVDQVTRNVQRILKVTGRYEIPVYRGTTCSLIGGRISSPRHGSDGFGDVPDPSPSEVKIQSENAVQALIRIVNENKGIRRDCLYMSCLLEEQLTLVCLAPLTNIARAIRLDPDFGKNLKDCVIMGGTYKGKGSITVCADFNFYADPESAHIVLKELNCSQITLVTFDLCIEYSFAWEWYEKFINTDTTLGRFFQKIESKSLEPYYSSKERKRSCDPMTMAIALDPKVVTQGQMVCCSVELTGELTQGQLIVDWKSSPKKHENVFLVEKIDLDRYKELFLRIVREKTLEQSTKS